MKAKYPFLAKRNLSNRLLLAYGFKLLAGRLLLKKIDWQLRKEGQPQRLNWLDRNWRIYWEASRLFSEAFSDKKKQKIVMRFYGKNLKVLLIL